jgi:hypothetical protein
MWLWILAISVLAFGIFAVSKYLSQPDKKAVPVRVRVNRKRR